MGVKQELGGWLESLSVQWERWRIQSQVVSEWLEAEALAIQELAFGEM